MPLKASRSQIPSEKYSYVGRTGRDSKERFEEHLQGLKNNNQNLCLMSHIRECGCYIKEDKMEILDRELDQMKR